MISYDSLLAPVHDNQHLFLVLPLCFLDILEGVSVTDREVLAQDLDIIDRLLKIIVYVLFDGEYSFLLVCILELLWQFVHPQMRIFVLEWNKLEFEVDIVVGFGLLCLTLVLAVMRVAHFDFHFFNCSLWLLSNQDIRVEFALFHSSLVRLMQKLRLELVVSLLEVWNQPIHNVLECNILHNGLCWFTAKLCLAVWTLVSALILAEKLIDASFAESAHTLVDSVSIPVDSFA